MSSATVAATDNRTRCDAIRHWLSPHRLHCIVLAAYVIVVATVMCFHEPWFDEAQAWLIARDCSWREMILERPHYEGHPPLWWMMLAIPAKLGVPYEMGLKTINLTCAALMIWLLESVLPVRRHVASLCADGRGHAAGGHQLEKP